MVLVFYDFQQEENKERSKEIKKTFFFFLFEDIN
jgi:CRISPR/Cas system-associated endoribonuclease Cas2